MEPLSVTVQLVPMDVWVFTKTNLARMCRSRAAMVGAVLLAAVALLPVPVNVARGDDLMSATVSDFLDVVLPLGAFMGIVYLLAWLLYRNGRVTRRLHPDLFERTTVSLSGEGLRWENALVTGVFRWPAIRELLETGTHLFAMLSKGKGIVLPKRCFPTAEAAALFANQIRHYMEAHRAAPPAPSAPAP